MAWKDGAPDPSPSAGVLQSTTEAGLCHALEKTSHCPHFVPKTSSWKLHFASPSSITIWNILLLRDSSPRWTHQFENPTQRAKCFF